METAVVIIGSLLTIGICYALIQQERVRVTKVLISQRTKILELEAGLLRLWDDVDQLYSEGQAKPSPKQVAVDPNTQPLLSDGLPLQGHIICVGQSGSGKSNVAMSQIIRRIQDGQDLYCIDTKNEIGPLFKRHMCEVVKPDQAERLLQDMLDIAEKRQILFETTSEKLELPCRDFGEYFKRTGERLPIITLIVEEMIVLMTIIDQDRLIKLLVLGRSAGVFVFALAQYLKADILDRRGSVNFNTRIYMGKYDKIGVGILFGTMDKDEITAARDFVGAPGKAIVEENGNMSLVTMPRVEDFHIIPYMKSA